MASKSYQRKQKAARVAKAKRAAAASPVTKKRKRPPAPPAIKPRHHTSATAVRLHTIEGKTYQEIADTLGITKGAVSQIMDRMQAKRRPRGRPRNKYRCVAKTRDGKRCDQRVKEQGARCWIHNRGKKA